MPSTISELSSAIHLNTSKISDFISSNGLPQPSFNVNTPMVYDFPPEVAACRAAVLESLYELQALILGPIVLCVDRTVHGSSSVHSIVRHNLASSVDINGRATYGQITKTCGVQEQFVRRLLRHAMAWFIFKEEEESGHVVHTVASAALVRVPLLSEWGGMVLDEMWPAQTRIADAHTKWPMSLEPQNTGFNLAQQEEEGFFEVLSKHPELILAKASNWKAHDGASVVDIGGSHGLVAFELSKAVPNLRVIVQDLPEVIADAVKDLPPALSSSDRVTFIAHDFFQDQPIKDADIYYLRMILHDWSDKYAVKILQKLRPALKPGAWILINEMCLPPPGSIPAGQERWMRGTDIGMMGLLNSHERDAEEWRTLLLEADVRFTLEDIVTPPGSMLSMLHVKWSG